MARHEFGMMPQAPEAGQRFEQYEPGNTVASRWRMTR